MSINQLKKFHNNEIELSKKVENLEIMIKQQGGFTQVASMTSKFGSTDLKDKNFQGTDSLTYMECNSIKGFIDETTLMSKITGLSNKKMEDTIRSINSNEELMIIDPTVQQSENVSVDNSPQMSNRKKIMFSKF